MNTNRWIIALISLLAPMIIMGIEVQIQNRTDETLQIPSGFVYSVHSVIRKCENLTKKPYHGYAARVNDGTFKPGELLSVVLSATSCGANNGKLGEIITILRRARGKFSIQFKSDDGLRGILYLDAKVLPSTTSQSPLIRAELTKKNVGGLSLKKVEQFTE